MGLDDRLLGAADNQEQDQSESSADRAGALNEARRGGEDGGNEDEPSSLREAVLAEKRKQADGADEETGAEGGTGGALLAKAAAPMRKGTSQLLRQAWLNLISSWGLTLIWINIHVFLGTIFGHNFFSKLGAEWLDNNISTANLEAKKKLGEKGAIVEGMGLACCDLGCLFFIIFVFAMIAMIAGFIDNPLRAIIDVLKTVFSNWLNLDSSATG